MRENGSDERRRNMDEKMDYRIGLDIGIASVGWAVLQNNSDDEPVRIVDLGVRIFDTVGGLEEENIFETESNGSLRIRV